MTFLLREVEIRNFKSHANSRIVFDEGINLISGRNGAGKSSVLEAILVALYGPRPTGLKKEDLVRSTASKYSITLKFEMDGVLYTLRRDSDGQSILSGKDVLLEGDGKINEWVERNIGAGHVFTNAIYVRQGEIEDIVKDEGSRERVIRRITRIDEFENAWVNLGRVIREFEREKNLYSNVLGQKREYLDLRRDKEKKLEDCRAELERNSKKLDEIERELKSLEDKKRRFEELSTRIGLLEREFERIGGELNSLRVKLRGLEERRDRVENRVAELEKEAGKEEELRRDAEEYKRLNELYGNLSGRIRKTEERLAELKRKEGEHLARIREIESSGKKLDEVREEIRRLQELLKNLEKDAEEWERVEELVRRKEEIEGVFRSRGYTIEKILHSYEIVVKAEEELRKLAEKGEKAAAKRASIATRINQLRKSIQDLKEAKNFCPVCGRELSESHKKELMSRYSDELEELRKKLSEVEEVRKRIDDRKAKIESVLSKRERILRLKQMADELARIENEIGKLELDGLKKAKDEFDRISNELKRLKGVEETLLSAIERLPEIERALEEVRKEIDVSEKEMEEILSALRGEGVGSIDELRSKVEWLKDKYFAWRSALDAVERLEREKKDLAEIKRNIESVKEEINRKEDEAERIKKEIDDLRRIYDEVEHRRVEEEFVKRSKELAATRERVEQLKRRIAEIERDLENIDEMVAKIEEYGRRKDVIEKRVIPELTKIRERIRQYKTMIAEAAFKEVEVNASEIFEEFTEGKYSGIVLKQVPERGKERLKIFVVYQGEEKDVSFLSGGEMVALALAFRLALSMFMVHGRIPLLILDEPTPFLDEERRRKLVEITTSYFRRIPQVIIVSHDDELKDAADRTIHVDQVGGVSVVEEV